MDLNRSNANSRDLILFDEPYDEEKYSGGIRSFDHMTYRDYCNLVRLNVIEESDRQNLAPEASKIARFLKMHPQFRAHGYAVSKKRVDYRVSIEGVSLVGDYTMQDVEDFLKLFKEADEIQIDPIGLYCWFD